MIIFFLIIGTLAAFSGSRQFSGGHNIAVAMVSVGCYACATALEIMK